MLWWWWGASGVVGLFLIFKGLFVLRWVVRTGFRSELGSVARSHIMGLKVLIKIEVDGCVSGALDHQRTS